MVNGCISSNIVDLLWHNRQHSLKHPLKCNFNKNIQMCQHFWAVFIEFLVSMKSTFAKDVLNAIEHFENLFTTINQYFTITSITKISLSKDFNIIKFIWLCFKYISWMFFCSKNIENWIRTLQVFFLLRCAIYTLFIRHDKKQPITTHQQQQQ